MQRTSNGQDGGSPLILVFDGARGATKHRLGRKCVVRLHAVYLALALAFLPVAVCGQERGANGQIPGELVPLVGLGGVRLEIHGLGGGGFWHGCCVAGDPETEITGLSRADHDRLAESLWADARETFRLRGVPLPEGHPLSSEDWPILVLEPSWYRGKDRDTFNVRVEVRLLEAARLVKDPGRIVWSSTWARTCVGFATRQTLAGVLQATVHGYVNEFGELYARAHSP